MKSKNKTSGNSYNFEYFLVDHWYNRCASKPYKIFRGQKNRISAIGFSLPCCYPPIKPRNVCTHTFSPNLQS